MTICRPLLAERTFLIRCHVFEPVVSFARCSGSYVERYVSFAIYLADKIHKLVGSETVWLKSISPIGVYPNRPVIGRTDSVAPMILIGEAATRPTNIWHFDGPQGFHYVGTDSTNVRYV